MEQKMSSTNRNILASLYIGILIIVLLAGCSTLSKTDRSTQYTTYITDENTEEGN